jgi:uncharacterized protein (TIGR02284 family)
MNTNEPVSELLNDLVKINNDRIETYNSAVKNVNDLDIDIKGLFEEMIRQSTAYKDELVSEMKKLNATVEDESTSSGKIYQAWMEIKATSQENKTDKVSLLVACEFGEDATQRAYESALTADCVLNEEVRQLIEDQQAGLKKSHDLIKKQRDAYVALSK